MTRKNPPKIPIHPSSGNVYADLRVPNPDRMLVKAQLAAEISALIRKRRLSQPQAAEILGLTQPKVSAILKGQFRGISEHRLLECLILLGRDVQILVQPAPRRRPIGRLTIRVA
jgi:predicted XRE-type DNA-binding protein